MKLLHMILHSTVFRPGIQDSWILNFAVPLIHYITLEKAISQVPCLQNVDLFIVILKSEH